MVFYSTAVTLLPTIRLTSNLSAQSRQVLPISVPAAEVAAETTRQFSARALLDFALIQRIKEQDDEKARADLLAFYHRPMQHFVARFVREQDVTDDLTMEIFMRVFRYLHSFRLDFAFSTWMFRVASNYCIDYLRRRRLETVPFGALGTNAAGEPTCFEVADTAPTPYEAVASSYRAVQLRQAINQLPPKYQRMVDLRYFQELSYEEIATQQQMPLGTVKAQLHHCRKLLHGLLERERETL